MRKLTGILMTAVVGASLAAPAYAIPTRDRGLLEVGECFLDGNNFRNMGRNLYGAIFEIDVDVTVGSGYSLIVDAFGSEMLGTDTELALYDGNGVNVLAINDDSDTGSLDPYLGFGDAPQFANPFNGSTLQGNITNELNLLAGRYMAVIGPFSTQWDSFDVNDSEVDNLQGTGEWVCQICLSQIPTPGSLALLGVAGLMIGHRRRH